VIQHYWLGNRKDIVSENETLEHYSVQNEKSK